MIRIQALERCTLKTKKLPSLNDAETAASMRQAKTKSHLLKQLYIFGKS